MQRRTKILTTLGPATDNPKVLADMLRAGADAVAALGIACPSIRMSWLQRRHFMRSVRPTTFSSGI